MHAGLAYDPARDLAVLVPAAKGLGKTSLSLLLASAGMQLATDELTVLFSASPPVVSGIPRRVGLSRETVERFFPQYLTSLGPEFVSPLDGGVKHLVRCAPESPPPKMALSVILVPGIHTGFEPEVKHLSPDDAAPVLYDALLANRHDSSTLYALAAHLAPNVPSFRILMGHSSAENARALGRWLRRYEGAADQEAPWEGVAP